MLEILDTVVVSAPYADVPIPMFLSSLTGMRYCTISCIECGAEILERNNDTLYRLNDPDLPAEVTIGADSIKVRCGNCGQWYGLHVSVNVMIDPDSMPLYMQPQSIYIQPAEHKRLRDMHCLFCGKTFYGIADRVMQVVDNRIPFEQLSPDRLGPIEAICRWNRCSQHWSIMV